MQGVAANFAPHFGPSPLPWGWCVIPNLSIDGATAGVSVNVWNAKRRFLERICQGNPVQIRESQQSRGQLSGTMQGMNSIQKVVTRKRKGDDDSAWKYWVTRPVTERLAMVEELRAEYHGWTNEPEPRLSRICRIIRRA